MIGHQALQIANLKSLSCMLFSPGVEFICSNCYGWSKHDHAAWISFFFFGIIGSYIF